MMRTAVGRSRAVEIAPMMVGEGTSPSTWIKKIHVAIAAARVDAGTALSTAAFTGLVEQKSRISAMIRAGQCTCGSGDARARYPAGTAASDDTAHTARLALRVTG